MFTGIIREIGTVQWLRRGDPWILRIQAPRLTPNLKRGDSVAVSGVCLTVVILEKDTFTVEVSRETITRSRFGSLAAGHPVNLEPALTLADGLDGHIVQGHVDETARITRITGGRQKTFWIRPSRNPGALIVEKGSVAVEGVSLTISDLRSAGEFSVSLIPLTLDDTTLGRNRAGDTVNLEYDILGKYVARALKIC